MKTCLKLSVLLYFIIALIPLAKSQNNYDDVYFSPKNHSNSVLNQNYQSDNFINPDNNAPSNSDFSNSSNDLLTGSEKTTSNSGIDYYNNLTRLRKNTNLDSSNINITNNYYGDNYNYSANNNDSDYMNYYTQKNRSRRWRFGVFYSTPFINWWSPLYNNPYFYSCNPFYFGSMSSFGNCYNMPSFYDNSWQFGYFNNFGCLNNWNYFGYYSPWNNRFGFNPYFNNGITYVYINNGNSNKNQKSGYSGPRNSSNGSGGALSSPVRNVNTPIKTQNAELLSPDDKTRNRYAKSSEKIFYENKSPIMNDKKHSLDETLNRTNVPVENKFQNFDRHEISSNQQPTQNANNNSLNNYADPKYNYSNQEPKIIKQQSPGYEKVYQRYAPVRDKDFYEKRSANPNSNNRAAEKSNEIIENTPSNYQPKKNNSYDRPAINPNTYAQPRETFRDNNSRNQNRSQNQNANKLENINGNQPRNHGFDEIAYPKSFQENREHREPNQNYNPGFRQQPKSAGPAYSVPDRNIGPTHAPSRNDFNGGNKFTNPSNVRNNR